MSFVRSIAALWGLGLASYIQAGPTSLNFIPISDVLGHRQVLMEFGSLCTEHQVDSTSYHCGALEVGLFDRIEFGIDLGLDPKYHAIWNAKAKLGETKDGKAAFSVGLWNCDEDYVEPFAVGSYDLGWSRLHFGLTHDDAAKLIAGADGSINKEMYWMADYMSGEDEQFWLGVGLTPNKIEGLDISWSIGVPLNSKQGWQASVTIGYMLKF